MAHRWIVTALGKDRPGIVAGVTKILYRLGCNLEDSAMTRLEGEFAIMLIFSVSARIDEERLQAAFRPLENKLGLVVYLKPLTKLETSAPRKTARIYLISVYGADRPGIVFRVAEFLAKANVNITDVHTHRSARVSGRSHSPLYLLLLEVELPTHVEIPTLEQRLKRLAKAMRVEVSLRQSEADVL